MAVWGTVQSSWAACAVPVFATTVEAQVSGTFQVETWEEKVKGGKVRAMVTLIITGGGKVVKVRLDAGEFSKALASPNGGFFAIGEVFINPHTPPKRSA